MVLKAFGISFRASKCKITCFSVSLQSSKSAICNILSLLLPSIEVTSFSMAISDIISFELSSGKSISKRLGSSPSFLCLDLFDFSCSNLLIILRVLNSSLTGIEYSHASSSWNFLQSIEFSSFISKSSLNLLQSIEFSFFRSKSNFNFLLSFEFSFLTSFDLLGPLFLLVVFRSCTPSTLFFVYIFTSVSCFLNSFSFDVPSEILSWCSGLLITP